MPHVILRPVPRNRIVQLTPAHRLLAALAPAFLMAGAAAQECDLAEGSPITLHSYAIGAGLHWMGPTVGNSDGVNHDELIVPFTDAGNLQGAILGLDLFGEPEPNPLYLVSSLNGSVFRLSTLPSFLAPAGAAQAGSSYLFQSRYSKLARLQGGTVAGGPYDFAPGYNTVLSPTTSIMLHDLDADGSDDMILPTKTTLPDGRTSVQLTVLDMDGAPIAPFPWAWEGADPSALDYAVFEAGAIGDLGGDGEPLIVFVAREKHEYDLWGTSLVFAVDRQADLQWVLRFDSAAGCEFVLSDPVIVNLDNAGEKELVFTASKVCPVDNEFRTDFQVLAYRQDGSPLWQSEAYSYSPMRNQKGGTIAVGNLDAHPNLEIIAAPSSGYARSDRDHEQIIVLDAAGTTRFTINNLATVTGGPHRSYRETSGFTVVDLDGGPAEILTVRRVFSDGESHHPPPGGIVLHDGEIRENDLKAVRQAAAGSRLPAPPEIRTGFFDQAEAPGEPEFDLALIVYSNEGVPLQEIPFLPVAIEGGFLYPQFNFGSNFVHTGDFTGDGRRDFLVGFTAAPAPASPDPVWYHGAWIAYSLVSSCDIAHRADWSTAHGGPKRTRAYQSCAGDFNDDFRIDAQDLVLLLANWEGCGYCQYDLDGNGVIGNNDLTQLVLTWGPCP